MIHNVTVNGVVHERLACDNLPFLILEDLEERIVPNDLLIIKSETNPLERSILRKKIDYITRGGPGLITGWIVVCFKPLNE